MLASLGTEHWKIRIERHDDGVVRPGDVVRGTARFERERASGSVELSAGVRPNVCSGGDAYSVYREGDPEERLFEGAWPERTERSFPFAVKIPVGPPTWSGKNVRVEWRVWARAHASGEYAELGEERLVVELPPGASVEMVTRRIEEPREGGGAWLALAFAHVVALTGALAMLDAPWRIGMIVLVVVVVDALLLWRWFERSRRALLAQAAVSLRVERLGRGYRDAPGGEEPRLEIAIRGLPEGSEDVDVVLQAIERWRVKGSKWPEENVAFEQRARLSRTGGGFESSIPLPELAAIGFSADGYFAGLAWKLVLQVRRSSGSVLRDTYDVDVRPVIDVVLAADRA